MLMSPTASGRVPLVASILLLALVTFLSSASLVVADGTLVDPNKMTEITEGCDASHCLGLGLHVAVDGDVIALADSSATHIYQKDGDIFDRVKIVSGQNVAVSGDLAVIGSPDALNPNGWLSGEVYVHSRDQDGSGNWGQVVALYSDLEGHSTKFGTTVATNGNFIAVNTPGGWGEVHIYKKDGGSLSFLTTLTCPTCDLDYDNNPDFGKVLAMHGDDLVVGAPRKITDSWDDINGGTAYVFSKDEGGIDNWGLAATLLAPVKKHLALFGDTVAIHEDRVVVGYESNVAVFDRTEGIWGWPGTAFTVSTTGERPASVAVSGDSIYVGMVGTRKNGEVWVYELSDNVWTISYNLQTLSDPPRSNADGFGTSVAVSGSKVIIGSPTYTAAFPDDFGSGFYISSTAFSSSSPPPVEVDCSAPGKAKQLTSFHNNDGITISYKRNGDSGCEAIKAREEGTKKWFKLSGCYNGDLPYTKGKLGLKKKLGGSWPGDDYKAMSLELSIKSTDKSRKAACGKTPKSKSSNTVSLYEK